MFNFIIPHLKLCSLSILLASCFLSLNLIAQIPAFPGAEGFGSTTPGGRGGSVIKVTNLNDSGPGSLRAAIDAEGPRIVVFEVGGLINLKTPLSIIHPYITLAGQTAPGDGISMRGNGIKILTHDVILRYIRVRPGDINFGPENSWGNVDAISIGNNDTVKVYNVVLDHCSLSWGVDENIGIWGDAHNVTVQYCIISEGLNKSKHPKGPHSKGMLIGGKSTNVSIHHNLFAHNNERNPLINGERTLVDFRNNVIYNAGGQVSAIIHDRTSPKYQNVNYVNNYIIPGPNKQEDWEITVRRKSEGVAKIFIQGNVGPNLRNPQDDNWNIVKLAKQTEKLPLSSNHRADQEFSHPAISTLSANDAFGKVLNEAGAILPRRDPVDKKVERDVRNRKGRIINAKGNSFEWPPFETGFPFLDTDDDGMPDHWEEQYGLNPKNSNDNKADPDTDGYTNIEEYINGTSPRSSTNETQSTFRGLSQNFSTLKLNIQQNYPNPFHDTTNVIFEISQASSTSLKLIDTNGKQINELIRGFLYEGKYSFTLDGSVLTPGIYYLVLQSGKSLKRIKIVYSD